MKKRDNQPLPLRNGDERGKQEQQQAPVSVLRNIQIVKKNPWMAGGVSGVNGLNVQSSATGVKEQGEENVTVLRPNMGAMIVKEHLCRRVNVMQEYDAQYMASGDHGVSGQPAPNLASMEEVSHALENAIVQNPSLEETIVLEPVKIVRCGSGTMTRSRRCDKPKPKFNGEHCKGKFADNLPCFRTCTGIIPTKSTFDSGSGSGSGSSEGSGSGDSGSGSGSEEGLDKEVESGGANKTVKNNETGAISEYGSGSGATNSGTSNKNTIISIKKQSLKAGSGEGSGEEEAGGLGDNESGDSKALTSSGNSAISSGKNIAKSDIVESLIETNVMDSNKSTAKRNEPGWGEKFEEIKL
eukprot:gene16270-17911_t